MLQLEHQNKPRLPSTCTFQVLSRVGFIDTGPTIDSLSQRDSLVDLPLQEKIFDPIFFMI